MRPPTHNDDVYRKYPGTPADSRIDSTAVHYSGITHQAIISGGGAETWCGEWAPGDRMTLFDSQNVTCPKCKSTSERRV